MEKVQKKAIISLGIMLMVQIVWLLSLIPIDNNINFTAITHSLIRMGLLWYLILIPLVLLMRKDKETLWDIGFAKDKIFIQIFIGVLVGALVWIVFFAIGIPLGMGQLDLNAFSDINIWRVIHDLFVFTFVVGLVEETVYRGYVFKKSFDITHSKWLAIILSSFLFGLFHFVVYGTNLILYIAAIAFALVYCICKEKIKHCTVLSLIVAHGIHNTLWMVFGWYG